MKSKVEEKLKAKKEDFKNQTGYPFDFFFCPLLLIDENTELCEAHIVNKAFQNTARSWTIQRKDVDGFYGRNFEAEFLKLEYKSLGLSPEIILNDKELAKRFNPRIQIQDRNVGFYYTSSSVPSSYSKVLLTNDVNGNSVALKIHPDELEDNNDVDIYIEHDLRLVSLVSLIKSAYLTLFEMLGYRYSLSPAGIFIGHDVLGIFYENNKEVTTKKEILYNAAVHFGSYVPLVRPVTSISFDIDGTYKDRKLFLCIENKIVWGCIVFIKIGNSIHAVLLPLFECEAGYNYYQLFLRSKMSVYAKLGKFNGASWEISPSRYSMNWPCSNETLKL